MELKTKKITFRDAEKKYRISKSTLQRKVNNKNVMKVGRPNTLSEKDEENLVKGICLSSKWGFPFTSMDIRLLVQQFLNKNDRHKSILSERLAENIKRSRAEINYESIKKYFEHLKNSLAGVSANVIINYDETNITDDRKILCKL
ncbi:jerky protein-like [Aphis craccivora]|uniref:Jerky protein-like n=1 Tax=Aphis craccivora TaxID=307492 RepID=A0A6G0YY12_APHCR|nr:jerky protein-like [Aphis craccivora]